MENSKLLEILKANSVEDNGFQPANIQQLQQCGLLPTPKCDDYYLNECSVEFTEPLSLFEYPLLFTSTTKKSGTFEKTITMCISSTAEFESVIAELCDPVINIVNKFNFDQVRPYNHHKAKALLSAGHECVADIYMSGRHLTIPVDSTVTLAEISLLALFRYPGHAFVFNDCEKALEFFKESKEHYAYLSQEQFLSQLETLANIQGQDSSPFMRKLKHETQSLSNPLSH